MSLACGFFNSEDGDRQYFNQDLSNFLEGLIEDGIYEFIDDKMMVSASATPDMHVLIGRGRAWFNGTWTKIDAAYQVDIPTADPVQNRIDAICLTVNKTRAVRDNYIEIISGTGSVDAPTKPNVQNETDIYRHVLAYVTVLKGTTAITQASIENRVGMGSALFSKPIWQNVPTTEEMVAQWQTQFDEFMDHIHETFDYDAAGNLQVGIDNLAPDIEEATENDLYVLDHNVLKKKDSNNDWTPTKVSAEIIDMKAAFQAGVDAVYAAVLAEGITPASSTPEAIAAAIAQIRSDGTASASDIITGKKAWVLKSLLTGSMADYRDGSRQTITPAGATGNEQIALSVGCHNSVIVNRTAPYNAGYNAGYANARTSFTGNSTVEKECSSTYAEKTTLTASGNGRYAVIMVCSSRFGPSYDGGGSQVGISVKSGSASLRAAIGSSNRGQAYLTGYVAIYKLTSASVTFGIYGKGDKLFAALSYLYPY